MRFTHYFLASAFVAIGLLAPSGLRADDEIKVYTVPKERAVQAPPLTTAAAASSSPDGTTMSAANIPVSSARVTWTTPASWKELAPTSMRIGNFSIPGQDGQKAEAAIFAFPGSVGTELGNVNRWRKELKLSDIDESQLASQPVTIDGTDGKLYELFADTKATVAVNVMHEGTSWVVKMFGDKDVVKDAEPVLRDFLKTIHFVPAGGAPVNDTAAAPTTPALPRPTAEASGEPAYTLPSTWKEAAPGPMILKRYTVADDKGKAAAVTISSLMGEGGGPLMNINRWRGQLGLQPLEDDKLEGVLQAIDTSAGTGMMVDFEGTDSRSGQPARLIAVMLRHGQTTWFFKFMGDSAVVGTQKESFVKFVKSVHYS